MIATEQNATIDTSPIKCRPSGFFVNHFGRHAMLFESLLFISAEKLLTDYSGGMWSFYVTQNGSPLLVPPGGIKATVNTHTHDGYAETALPAVLAGCYVTAYAIEVLMNSSQNMTESIFDRLDDIRRDLLHSTGAVIAEQHRMKPDWYSLVD